MTAKIKITLEFTPAQLDTIQAALYTAEENYRSLGNTVMRDECSNLATEIDGHLWVQCGNCDGEGVYDDQTCTHCDGIAITRLIG